MSRARRPPARRARGARPNRRGLALPVAIGALVLLAALVASVELATRVEARAGDASVAGVRARAAAEGALASELAGWDRTARLAMPVGGTDSSAHALGELAVRVRVARLRADAWLAEAVARAPTGLAGGERFAERRARADLRLVPLTARVSAAVTAADSVHVGAGGLVDGTDVPPAGWSGCDAASDSPAIAAPDLSLVVADPAAVVTGATVGDPAAADPDTYAAFGDERWTALAARADVSLGGAVTRSPLPVAGAGGRCTMSGHSWGEPLRGSAAACDGGFALVHAAGAAPLAVQGPARAQGVLLVDGDLEMTGDATIAGLVVVRGRVRLSAGARVLGALLAHGPVTVDDGARVTFSRCAVRAALRGVARVAPLARRAWSY